MQRLENPLSYWLSKDFVALNETVAYVFEATSSYCNYFIILIILWNMGKMLHN
jgi:hypothetical protein